MNPFLKLRRAPVLILTGLPVIILAIMSLLSACDDSFNDVGIEGLDQDALGGRFVKDTLFADRLTNAVSFMDSVSTSQADRLYLGATDGYEFKMLFYFIIPADAESAIVLSNKARLNLTTAGSYGGSGSFTATVHPIIRSWDASDIRWDRFQQGVDYAAAPMMQFSVSSSDTVNFHQALFLPRDTVQNWVWALKDTTRHNFGILIDFPAGAGFAAQFYGAGITEGSGSTVPDKNYAPSLVFEYQKLLTSGEIQYDSVTAFPVALSSYNGGRQGYLYRDLNPQPSSALNVGSGVIYHSFLRFNTLGIPRGATINKADLILNVNPDGNYRRQAGDSISLQTVRNATDTSGWTPGNVEYNSDDYYSITYSNLGARWLTDNSADDTLKFTITTLLQDWIDKPSANYGLQIFHAKELNGSFNRLYRLRFVNDVTDKYRSPRIIIYYTLPPEE